MQPTRFVGDLRHLEEMRLRIWLAALARVLYFVDEMRHVALIARNAVAGVFRVLEKVLLFAAGVASQAARSVFRRVGIERKNRMFFQRLGDFGVVAMRRLHRIGMRLPWTVAAFTALYVVLAGEGDLGVVGFAELGSFTLVASGAARRADEIRCRCVEFGS